MDHDNDVSIPPTGLRHPPGKHPTAVMTMLGWLIQELEDDAVDVNRRQFPINDCKAVANTLTKLKEAKMWHREAGRYYASR